MGDHSTVTEIFFVGRPPTSLEIEERRSHYLIRTKSEATRERLNAWVPKDDEDSKKKEEAERGYAANLDDIERLVNHPIYENHNRVRQMTAEELVQREIDWQDAEQLRVAQEEERERRKASMAAILDKLGLTFIEMRTLIEAIDKGDFEG